jgi:S-(hydroxymethyl)glutathione dehydrogenase/alcohol dehydrogenase
VRIRAAVLRRPGRPVAVEDVELEPPREGEVLVRVAAAGVCHSDLRLAEGELGEGRWPMVLGHEGAGVVAEVGPGVSAVRPGDRVGLCFVPACRSCVFCRAGRPNLCLPAGESSLRGTLRDGTSRLRLADGAPLQHALMTACLAEYTVVDQAGVVPLPPSLPLWQAALLGCSVVTGFGAVRHVAQVRPGESVCVIGCGGVGLQVLAACRVAGAAPIVAVDRDPAKLALALKQGATHVLDVARQDVRAAVLGLTGGLGVEHAFEVVGRAETMRLAWEVLRPGATAVVVGLAARGVEVSLPAIDFLADKGIRGTYYGSGDAAADLRQLAGLAARGTLDLAAVVSHVARLDGVAEALERLRRGEGARTVIVIDETLAEAPLSPRGGKPGGDGPGSG